MITTFSVCCMISMNLSIIMYESMICMREKQKCLKYQAFRTKEIKESRLRSEIMTVHL